MSVPKQAVEQLEQVEKALEESQANEVQEDTYQNDTTQIANEVHNDEELSEQQGLVSQTSPMIEGLQKELELERQRTASLKGRIESQLKETHSENKELKSQISEMMSQLEELKQVNRTPGFKRKLSEEEINDVGEEVLELQDRVIKGTIEEELENGSIKELVQSLVDKSVAAREEKIKPSVDKSWFWSNVENFYPGAKAINQSDAGWHSFLERYDSVSGLQYRQVGNKAIEEGDIPALVDLFKAYKPIVAQEQEPAIPAPAAKPENVSARMSVENETPPVFTQAEVKKFYADRARGNFKGNQQEWKKLESEIMDAAQEGRII